MNKYKVHNMQNTYHNDDLNLTLEYNNAWLHLPQAEPVLVIAVTKIVWRGVQQSLTLAVETNVFPADLDIETIAKEIATDLKYNFG